MKSQNATAILGNVTACEGESILVPLDVVDFNNVGAMTFYIGYDTNAAAFLSIQNINPAIPGSISYNAFGDQVSIVYSYTEPFYLTGEKLFDLSFTFLSDSTGVFFKPGTEIATVELEVIPLDTVPGSIANSITIIDQPDSVQSYPDSDVFFKITSTGTDNYQWQENTGSGWLDLQNDDTYSGVTTDSLTIFDVPVSFNGNTYRCLLTTASCTIISDVALLEVAEAFPAATLGYISSCPENEILEPMLVGDFFDVIEFNFNIAYNTTALAFIELADIYPGLENGTFTLTPMGNPPGITIHWENDIPVSITSGTLFYLKFDYGAGNQVLSFAQGCYVLNSLSNPLNITLTGGEVEQNEVPLIAEQPEDETVMEFDEASFNVVAGGAEGYQWMVSTDNGNSWTGLTNTPPYFNAFSPTLTINPATYNMNQFLYACRLNSELCTIQSDPAILTVDSLTFISDQFSHDGIKIYPVPCNDNLRIVNEAFGQINSLHIFSLQGVEYKRYTLYNLVDEGEGLNLDVSSLPQGLYILHISGIKGSKRQEAYDRILKTD